MGTHLFWCRQINCLPPCGSKDQGIDHLSLKFLRFIDNDNDDVEDNHDYMRMKMKLSAICIPEKKIPLLCEDFPNGPWVRILI